MVVGIDEQIDKGTMKAMDCDKFYEINKHLELKEGSRRSEKTPLKR